MTPEQIKEQTDMLDQKLKEAHEFMEACPDLLTADISKIKEFNRKLTIINREICRMLKTLNKSTLKK